ncbi:hypothetical protein ACFQMG_24985 [Kitasatospora paranensis]|uniref:Uncharacterized protein n=1 Tax=Kitasatospora paranensis TaxID=258053 RepID=A0ABW2FZX6_9ACTN
MNPTGLLDDKSSALRAFFDDEFPALRALRASYRAALSPRLPAQRPAPPVGSAPRWGTIGAAIDRRLRWSLRSVQPRGRSVEAGIAISAEYAPVLRLVGAELLDTIDDLIARERLDGRVLPVARASETEDRLARLAWAAALFEEVFRTGRVWPAMPLAEADGSLTLETLMRAVPDHEVRDIAAMVERACHGGLEALRAATAPDQVVLAPTFAAAPMWEARTPIGSPTALSSTSRRRPPRTSFRGGTSTSSPATCSWTTTTSTALSVLAGTRLGRGRSPLGTPRSSSPSWDRGIRCRGCAVGCGRPWLPALPFCAESRPAGHRLAAIPAPATPTGSAALSGHRRHDGRPVREDLRCP